MHPDPFSTSVSLDADQTRLQTKSSLIFHFCQRKCNQQQSYGRRIACQFFGERSRPVFRSCAFASIIRLGLFFGEKTNAENISDLVLIETSLNLPRTTKRVKDALGK